MMTRADNQALARELTTRLAAVNTTVRTLRDTLSPEQFGWRPPEGAWSVADVLEHLIRSHDSYLPSLRAAVRDATAPAGEPRPWKKTLLGGWLANSMRSERRLPSPGIWKIPAAPRADVADEFIERQQELSALIDAAVPLDWRGVRMTSPVTRLVRMNLGDTFEVLTSHAERHGRQMERLLERSEFPGRSGAAGGH